MVEITAQSPDAFIELASAVVIYKPDAYALAEAIAAGPDWFITHDKPHFLSVAPDSNLAFRIGTPGDLIQSLEDEFTQS
jgi:predicted nucleic acid-binding protein